LERLEGTKGPSKGGYGPGFGLRVLHDHAVVTGKSGLNPGRIGSEDHDSSLYLERFQSLQDSNHEREAEEVQ
jgi:hypothetical protein